METDRVIHSLLAATLIAFYGTNLHAQELPASVDIPTISRMCLWNADADTWGHLALSHRQIARLQELRQRYPAVVNGQWILTPEMEASDRGEVLSAANAALTVGAGDIPVGEAGPNASRGSKGELSRTLQSDLRAVLSGKQLRAWKKICP